RIDPEIDGRTLGEGRPLLGRARTESAIECRSEPFREIALNMDRSIHPGRAVKRTSLAFAKKTRPVGFPHPVRHAGDRLFPRVVKRGEDEGARRGLPYREAK